MPALAMLLSTIGTWIGQVLASQTAKAIIWKALIWSIVTVTLPVVLYKLQVRMLSEMLTATSSITGSPQSIAVQLTGFLGWLAIQFKIPESFSMLLTALSFRVTMGLVTSRIGK